MSRRVRLATAVTFALGAALIAETPAHAAPTAAPAGIPTLAPAAPTPATVAARKRSKKKAMSAHQRHVAHKIHLANKRRSAARASRSYGRAAGGMRAGAPSAVGVRAVGVASTKRGTPYRYGATGPRAFDCSGLTSWTYARLGKRLPRTANAQYHWSRKISRSQARPGDLVFFGGRHKTHVGIYAGNGRMWHAPRTGDVVKLAKIYRTASYGRVR